MAQAKGSCRAVLNRCGDSGHSCPCKEYFSSSPQGIMCIADFWQIHSSTNAFDFVLMNSYYILSIVLSTLIRVIVWLCSFINTLCWLLISCLSAPNSLFWPDLGPLFSRAGGHRSLSVGDARDIAGGKFCFPVLEWGRRWHSGLLLGTRLLQHQTLHAASPVPSWYRVVWPAELHGQQLPFKPTSSNTSECFRWDISVYNILRYPRGRFQATVRADF